MKRKIFSIVLVICLLAGMLVGLTACGDEDEEEKETSSSSRESRSSVVETERQKEAAEGVLKQFATAVNNKNADTAVSLLDIDEMEVILNQTINKKDLKNGFEQFFEEQEDFTIKVSDIEEIGNPEEVLQPILTAANMSIDDGTSSNKSSSKNELTKEQQEEIDKYVWMSAKLKLSGEYGEAWDEYQDEFVINLDGSLENKDIIIMTEEDGEYKIVYSMYLIYLQNRVSVVSDNTLQKASETQTKIRIATAEETLQLAISGLQAKFVAEGLSAENQTIGGYVLLSRIQDELPNGYYVISYNKNTGEGMLTDSEEYRYSFVLEEKNQYMMDIIEFEEAN